ncbi:MAG: chromate transporter, partial [Acidimicrobiia bacterium]|nr:chromate transporter [Acidimicrobiia bacterium]
VGAPFIESLRGKAALTSALSTVTAAVVGVVLNLAIWFTLFTLFGTVEVWRGYGAVLYRPDFSTLNWAAAAIAVVAGVAIFRFDVKTLRVVGVAAVAGMAYQFMLV